jgi:hypothetical protein
MGRVRVCDVNVITEVGVAFHAGADALVLLVDGGVATAVDEDVWRDKAGNRNDLSGEFQGVSP